MKEMQNLLVLAPSMRESFFVIYNNDQSCLWSCGWAEDAVFSDRSEMSIG